MYCHTHHCHYNHCNCVPTDSKEKGGALTQEELLALTQEMKQELKDYTVDLKDQIFSYIDIGLNPVEIANTFASLKEQDTFVLKTLTKKIDEVNNSSNLSMFNLRTRVTDLEGQSAATIQDLTDRTQRIVELETNTQVVESISDLLTIKNLKDGLRVYVKSYHAGFGKGGGYFTYDSKKKSENNGITIFDGWIRDELKSDINAFDAGCVGNADHGSYLDHEGMIRITTYIKELYSKNITEVAVTFEKGEYICQKERPISSEFRNTAEGSFSLSGYPKLKLTINFNNSVFTARSNMRIGTFYRSDMRKYEGSNPFYGNAQTVFFTPSVPFYINGVDTLIIKGVSEVNGNVSNHIVGGVYSDSGIQFASIGWQMVHIDHFTVEGLHISHSHSNDGFYLAGANPKDSQDDLTDGRYMNISGLIATRNGRNGISFVGGKNSSWYNCLSYENGLPDHPTASNPRSNIDIEAEVTPIRRARFYNFKSNLAGADGLVSALGDSRDVIFYDSVFINNTRSAWIERPQFKFYNCSFNGSIISGYYAEKEEDRTQYIDCVFDEDVGINPSTAQSRPYLMQFNGKNPIFNNCVFNNRYGNFIWSSPRNGKIPTFIDCTLNFYAQTSDGMYGAYEFKGFTLYDKRPITANTLYLAITSSLYDDFVVKCDNGYSGVRIDGTNPFDKYMLNDNKYTLQVISNYTANKKTHAVDLIPKYKDGFFVKEQDFIKVLYADSLTNIRKNTVDYNKGDTIHCTDPEGQSGTQKWVCIQKGVYNTVEWSADTAYLVNTYVNVNNKVYKATIAGTSGSTAPTHSANTATDNTVTWEYINTLAIFKAYS